MVRMIGMIMLILLFGGALALLTSQAGLAAAGPEPLNLNVRFLPADKEDLVRLRDLAGELGWGLEYLPREEAVLVKSGERVEKLEIPDKSPAGRELQSAPRIVDGRTWIGLETAGLLVRRMNPDLTAVLTGFYPLKELYRSGDEITVQIKVYNPSTDVLQLDFSSGKRYDLYLNLEGREVWRWSEGRFFTMALARVELKPGEELTYQLKIPTTGLAPGLYTMSGELSTLKSLKLSEEKVNIAR